MGWGIRFAVLAAASITLTGCATSSQIPLPNNEQGFAIECPRVGQCYRKAQEVCPTGYELLDKGSSTQGGFASGVGAIGQKQSLIVRCKAKP